MLDKRTRRIRRHVRLAIDHERAFAGDLRKIFAAAGRAAASHVAKGEPGNAENVASEYANRIAISFRARMQTAAEASAKLTIDELTGEQKFISLFETAQRAIRDWISQHAAAKVVNIVERLRRTIRRSIERGNELNEPPRVLGRRIRDETGGAIGRKRAVTIARTETHTATQVGSKAAADATGLQLLKEWGATEDARTRASHAIADGQTVERDADFVVGGERCSHPGDDRLSAKERINCRCVALYRVRYR